MSNFINQMFCEKGRERKPVMERMLDIRNLNMSCSETQAVAMPKMIIDFNFQALWTMHARGAAEEYNEIHKIAIKALKRAVYEEFYDKLTYLELALYDHDVEKAKKIIQGIKKEVGL